jgi:hypothetical protein
MTLDEPPVWCVDGEGGPPCSMLCEVLFHVLVETTTHAGHLDICRELVDGGQRLVLDRPGCGLRPVGRDRLAHQRHEGVTVERVALEDVDGSARAGVEAGVEES